MRTAEPRNRKRVSAICLSTGLSYGPMTSASPPSLWTDADANGLAKLRTTACRSHHAGNGKCVGANPSPIEGGYSPMTGLKITRGDRVSRLMWPAAAPDQDLAKWPYQPEPPVRVL